jgi:hypothetical protein
MKPEEIIEPLSSLLDALNTFFSNLRQDLDELSRISYTIEQDPNPLTRHVAIMDTRETLKRWALLVHSILDDLPFIN